MEFNITQMTHLKNFLDEDSPVRNTLLMGKKGLGKSYVIKKLISDRHYIIISFSKDLYLPFEYIRKGLSLTPDLKREGIIHALSDAYVSNYYIVYENLEYCDKDSMELIKQVIQFHDTYRIPAISIFELNSETIPDYISWINANPIKFFNFSNEEIDAYIRSIIRSNDKKKLTYACNQLVSVARGNLLSLHLAINILLQKGILVRSASAQFFQYIGDEFSDSLFFLYMNLFQILDTHIQDTLRIIIPFENRVNISLLKETFSHCRMIEYYLDEISRYRSFIFKENNQMLDEILENYIFPVEQAKEAVIESTIDNYIDRITAELVQHLEKMYQQAKTKPNIKQADYIYLLSLLTKLKKQKITIIHLPYYVELMQCYFENSSYAAVTRQAEQFLSFNILSITQINTEQPQFFRIYFKALLALGQYSLIITYLDKLPDWDIKLLIACAYYNNGNPKRALGLCNELKEAHNCGEIFSLEASIYDWMGDNRHSLISFKKALKYISDNEALKYSLYKKYSLYIDFELPECKTYLEKALTYYENISIRKYAETLHNYGTDSILTFLPSGMNDLAKAKELFVQICEKETYYPLNSLAIGHCLEGKYNEAVIIWEKINIQQIEIDFCRFTILNNLFCAYIKLDNLRMAKNIKIQLSRHLNILETMNCLKSFVKGRPDLQHPLRQYLLNCGLLELKQDNIQKALHYFALSIDCSKYHSTMLYLIQSQLTELQTDNVVLKNLLYKIKAKKLGVPGKLARFFAQHKMYYCILMFWGDN